MFEICVDGRKLSSVSTVFKHRRVGWVPLVHTHHYLSTGIRFRSITNGVLLPIAYGNRMDQLHMPILGAGAVNLRVDLAIPRETCLSARLNTAYKQTWIIATESTV